MTKTILPLIHTSEETAYLIEDYPYGRTLRCQKRVWLEIHPKKGTRLVSRTSNPKRNNDWNNATKSSTYSDVSGALYLDENNHIQWDNLHSYCDLCHARKYLDKYGHNASNYDYLVRFVAAKEALEADTAGMSYGTPEYNAASMRARKILAGKI